MAIILIILTGCLSNLQKEDKTMKETISYLALGDSYTIGESLVESERWPVQLAESLKKTGIDIDEPVIVARTGWTTDELKAGIANKALKSNYGLVSLLIGVNNQYRGKSVEEFRHEFISLLEHAVQFAGGKKDRVFVVSIPDWGVSPFAEGRDRISIAKEIDAFNTVKQVETEKRGIIYVDITPISRKAATDSTLIASDGLHPSGKMYSLWVEKITPIISNRLK